MNKKFILIGVTIILLAFIPIAFDSYKMGQWKNESIEYTDQFIRLLAKENYCELKKLYNISGDQLEDFKRKFGTVSGYTFGFINASKDGASDQYTGYFMHYMIRFQSDEPYQGTFSIRIDNKNNKPIPGDIEHFNIMGRNPSRQKHFYIEVSKKTKLNST